MAPKKKTIEDPAWANCSKIDGSRLHLQCNYCAKPFWGGITRMKHHLAGTSIEAAPCTQCPEDVKESMALLLVDHKKSKRKSNKEDECFEVEELEVIEVEDSKKENKGSLKSYLKGKGQASMKQKTMNEMIKKRDPVIRDICRCLYKNALPFNLVKCPTFKKMLQSVGEYGRGLKPPSYHEARVTYLKKEVEHVEGDFEKYKKEWKRTGCTLMSDGWSDGKSRHLTNFLVNSPSGTVFLKSVDTSSIIKDGQKLFELLDGIVEEIGEENVVQVVTDSASAYVSAGELLMEKRKNLFWSPCAAHILDLILEDIGEIPVFKDTIQKAKDVAKYIYNHSWVLSLFRKYSNEKELTRPGVTRFATCFLTLSNFEERKKALRKMFLSKEWDEGPYKNKSDAKKVENIILYDSKFWKAITYCLKCVKPLTKVLRLVDGDAKPAMGYIYEAMDRAKEEIAKSFDNEKKRYERIWDIIDKRWDLQLHRPLHAATYYLNPKFHYDDNFHADKEVKKGLIRTIERMFPDLDTRLAIDEQLDKFHMAHGMFGTSMAKATRTRKQPALWWDSYGKECKELQELAIRVLSLTCSATGCERNWSIFDHVHSKKRNRLAQQRLNALVFVKYNIQLQLRQEKREARGETYDPISLSDMESDDEWITEMEDPCFPNETSWKDIHECFKDEVGTSKRKRGPRNLQDNKKGKRKASEALELIDDDTDEEVECLEVDDNEDEEMPLEDDEGYNSDDINLDDDDYY